MKLALIRQRYNPYGGAERFIERAITALRAQNEDVEVTVFAREWQAAPGVQCVPINTAARGNAKARDVAFGDAVERALAARRGQFDIIQSHERIPGMPVYRAGDGVHAQWLRLRAQHGGARARMATLLNPYHRYMVARERAMFTHPALRLVICNSQMVRGDIERAFGVADEKLCVIYNGVDIDYFQPPTNDERRVARAQFALPSDAPTFVYVGSGFERKGVATLLDAFAQLPKEAHLLIVGEDKARVKFAALAVRLRIDHRVQFLGGLRDVLPVYHAAHALVLPTLYDPMPNVVPEALACGLPVITTTTCGGAELLNAQTGSVIAAGDVTALAKALRGWCAPSALQCRAAREAAELLAAPRQATVLLTLYQRLMAA